MLATKASRRRNFQMPASPHTAERDGSLGVSQIVEQALAILQKSTAFMRQRDARAAADKLPRVATETKASICFSLSITVYLIL